MSYYEGSNDGGHQLVEDHSITLHDYFQEIRGRYVDNAISNRIEEEMDLSESGEDGEGEAEVVVLQDDAKDASESSRVGLDLDRGSDSDEVVMVRIAILATSSDGLEQFFIFQLSDTPLKKLKPDNPTEKKSCPMDCRNSNRIVGILSIFLNAFPDGANQEVVEACVHDICKEEVSKAEIQRVLSNSPQVFRKFGDKWKFVAFSM